MAKKAAKRVATLPPGQTSMTAEEYRCLSRGHWSEVDFQQEVIALAHRCGYRVAHFRKVRVQRQNGSCYYETPVQADGAGWPDLVCIGAGQVLWIELKVKSGKLSAEQKQWRDALIATGQRYFCWWPRDWEMIENTFAPRC